MGHTRGEAHVKGLVHGEVDMVMTRNGFNDSEDNEEHGKMEKWLGGEKCQKRERECVCVTCVIHTCVGGAHVQNTSNTQNYINNLATTLKI